MASTIPSARELVARIRRVGDPILSSVSASVVPTSPKTAAQRAELHATLAAFRSVMGFGRAIAAPQIGLPVRMIALNLGPGKVYTMHNPALINYSAETITMCVGPSILSVRARR